MKGSRYSLKIWSKGGLPGKCRNRDTVWIVESRAAARNALCNAPPRQGRDYGLAALLQSLQDAFDIGLAQPDGFREENASHSQKNLAKRKNSPQDRSAKRNSNRGQGHSPESGFRVHLQRGSRHGFAVGERHRQRASSQCSEVRMKAA